MRAKMFHTTKKPITKKIRRRGAAVVEFAVTAPVLFAIMFGMIETGRGLMVKQLLANAARDGARSAILEGATVEEVQKTVLGYLGGSRVDGATVTVLPNPLTLAQGGDPVSVTVSIPFNDVSWLPTPKYLAGVTLEETVVMRREVFTSTESSSVDEQLP
jgi:Flp pilus assembly protein TadG